MPELQVINTLNTKADGLRSHIVRLERELEATKAALSHVLAIIHMFEAPQNGSRFPLHYNMPSSSNAGKLWVIAPRR